MRGLCCYAGFFLVLVSWCYSWLGSTGFSLMWLLLLQSVGSVVLVLGFTCSEGCGIFLDQGLNPCPLHWQEDSLPLSHQGNPNLIALTAGD